MAVRPYIVQGDDEKFSVTLREDDELHPIPAGSTVQAALVTATRRLSIGAVTINENDGNQDWENAKLVGAFPAAATANALIESSRLAVQVVASGVKQTFFSDTFDVIPKAF